MSEYKELVSSTQGYMEGLDLYIDSKELNHLQNLIERVESGVEAAEELRDLGHKATT